MALRFKSGLIVFALVVLGCTLPCLGQASQETSSPASEHPAGEQMPDQQLSGSIRGTIVDGTGAVVAGARVTLTGDQPLSQEVLSDSDGLFSFTNIAPGPFQLTVTSAGFAKQTSSGTLYSGQTCIVPPITLAVATAITDVEVVLSPAEVAEEQIKEQEKQRVLGFIPNFYVSYVPDAVPLSPKQKFTLAWKMTIDPVTLVLIGGTAGVQQAQNDFSEYGQGAQGYAKRYGAGFADTVSSTFIGGAILPSLLKQDPRYFYKGTGGTRSRILYAVATSVICKGDNGRWQANYSGILGALAAGGISKLYYPATSGNGAAETFENALIGIGEGVGEHLFQEFLVRKLTPKLPKRNPTKP
jgi:hypothetical protein